MSRTGTTRRSRTTAARIALAVLAGLLTSPAWGDVIWHDPYLNWDFWNTTGLVANDLEIVVENPNFAPNLNDPAQAWAVPFPTIGLSNADHDNDGDQDTIVTYSGANVSPDADGMPYGQEIPPDSAHGGLYMKGSGKVLDAYWTLNGVQIGPSYPITYERTRVVGDPALYMELNIAPGFFLDPANAGVQAGWTEIRTFVNLPADLLNLPDLNRNLDLSTLAEYEVVPRIGGPQGPPVQPSDLLLMSDSSILDLFLAEIPPEFAGPQYEALLVATVMTSASPPLPAGAFWNLNPQSPEPGTMALLALGTTGVLLARRSWARIGG